MHEVKITGETKVENKNEEFCKKLRELDLNLQHTFCCQLDLGPSIGELLKENFSSEDHEKAENLYLAHLKDLSEKQNIDLLKQTPKSMPSLGGIRPNKFSAVSMNSFISQIVRQGLKM